MIEHRIVYTGHGGDIVICCPSPEIFRVMSSGGWWSDYPRGYLELQIERQIADGIDPDHAKNFAHAVHFGGLTEAEVWRVVRDRDCMRHGSLHELQHVSELPDDDWFGPAWKRSGNGGPIGVDLERAMPVQWAYIRRAVEAENKRRADAFLPMKQISPPWEMIRSAIKHARDEDELRKIWPEELPRP